MMAYGPAETRSRAPNEKKRTTNINIERSIEICKDPISVLFDREDMFINVHVIFQPVKEAILMIRICKEKIETNGEIGCASIP